jgi:two-component system phosphate regulon sensor histidine kinase PhoR
MKSTTRSLLVFLFCLAVLIGTFIIIISRRMERIMRAQIEEGLKRQATIAEFVIRPIIAQGSDSALAAAVLDLAHKSGNRITVIDPAGRVLADSDHDLATMDNHLSRQEVREALDAGWGISLRHSNTQNIDFLYVAKKLEKRPDAAGFIRLAVPLGRIGALNQSISWLIGGLGVILFFLVASVSHYYSIILRKPLREVGSFCAELKAGNYRARLIKPGSGRIADLYLNLNAAAENLEANFQTISRERDILAGVLAALDEGVAVTNEKGAIIMTNEPFRTMFAPGGAPENKNIWEIIHDSRFLDLVDVNRADRSAKNREINFIETGKTFMVSVFFTPVFQGWVYAFQDVTGARNLEKIKADFITNLSHELRTPLTAIKGYVETLEDAKPGSAEHDKFIKIIRDNTDRIINIVSDLLTLSDIERPGKDMDRTAFDLNQLAADVIILFAKEALKKKLALEFSPHPIPEFYGDRFMIQQLLINLVSNGIRFTEKGRVELDISSAGDAFIIRITDTGIGIPADQLPRIFERFYRVDKARSRSQGGTGLGLAIVKHSVQAHGGKVMVESKLGQGTTFTAVIPRQAS